MAAVEGKVKLSVDDIRQIKTEGYLRRIDKHTLCVVFKTTRKNEYLEFLQKCKDHATSVGDSKIYLKLRDEEQNWREVE